MVGVNSERRLKKRKVIINLWPARKSIVLARCMFWARSHAESLLGLEVREGDIDDDMVT